MSVNFRKSTSIYVLIAAICAFGLGIYASYEKVSNAGFKASSGNIFADILLNFPTWLGTFLGVLLGAYLAYDFNRKKQLEDNKKEEYKTLSGDIYEIHYQMKNALKSLVLFHEELLKSSKEFKDGIKVEDESKKLFLQRGFNMLGNYELYELEKLDFQIYKLSIIEDTDENIDLLNDINRGVKNFNKLVTFLAMIKESQLAVRNGMVKFKKEFYAHNTDPNDKCPVPTVDELVIFCDVDSIHDFLHFNEVIIVLMNHTLTHLKAYPDLSKKLIEHLNEMRGKSKDSKNHYNFFSPVDPNDLDLQLIEECEGYQSKINDLIVQVQKSEPNLFRVML